MFSVSIKGLEKNRRVLGGIVNELDKNQNLSLHQLGQDIVVEAQQNLVGNANINSWELFDSIKILEEGDKYIIVGTNKDYAGYIEYSRGPVRPIQAKILHWIDKDTGKDVFAMFSKATEPMPFMEPAVISKTQNFVDIFAERILGSVSS